MALLDWLRKLGILRFGAEKAVYHNAKERPLSMQQGDIFNSERDLAFGGRPPEAGKPDSQSPESQAR